MSALLLLAAAAAVPPTLTVGEVLARHGALEGQAVHIDGWMTRCQPLSCAICDEKPPRAGGWRGRCLSLGANPDFDRSVWLAGAVGSRVVIEGRVTAHCFPDPDPGSGTITICTDRADQIVPIRLMSVAAATGRKDQRIH